MSTAADRPLAVIELDAFCEHCGFNLRSQPIWRDERLGLLVCRCPECGAHQSAVGRASALRPWLNRLALLLAIAWVGIGLAFAAALFLACFGMQAAVTEGLTNQTIVMPDGSPVTYSFNGGKPIVVRERDRATAIGAGELAQRRTLVPLLGGPKLDAQYGGFHDVTWLGVGLTAAAFALAVYVAGALLSAGCWFWRRRLRFAWLALPPVATLLSVAAMRSDGMASFYETLGHHVTYERGLAYALIAGTCGLQLLVLALGLATGRAAVRGVLLVFCPPGVRQLFAFLWHCDGRTMPRGRIAIVHDDASTRVR